MLSEHCSLAAALTRLGLMPCSAWSKKKLSRSGTIHFLFCSKRCTASSPVALQAKALTKTCPDKETNTQNTAPATKRATPIPRARIALPQAQENINGQLGGKPALSKKP